MASSSETSRRLTVAWSAPSDLAAVVSFPVRATARKDLRSFQLKSPMIGGSLRRDGGTGRPAMLLTLAEHSAEVP